MNAKLSQKMTLLGLCAMAFYGLMLASGQSAQELMPQFMVSALVFLFSGRLLRMAGARSGEKGREEEAPKSNITEEEWRRVTRVLNWSAVCIILSVLTLWVLTPQDATLAEFVRATFVDPNVHINMIAP